MKKFPVMIMIADETEDGKFKFPLSGKFVTVMITEDQLDDEAFCARQLRDSVEKLREDE